MAGIWGWSLNRLLTALPVGWSTHRVGHHGGQGRALTALRPPLLQRMERFGGGFQLVLAEHLHAGLAQRGGGYPLAVDQGAAEAAVVVLAVAAGRAAGLEDGQANVVLAYQLQRRLGAGAEGGGDVQAVDGQHRHPTGQHLGTVAAGNLRRRARGGQAARHFRTQGHQAALGLPVPQPLEGAMTAPVVAYRLAQQAGADQDAFLLRRAGAASRSVPGARGGPAGPREESGRT